jgi:prepilin-type N-terminal cleavage/methylation domain-containing protein
MHGKKRSAFTLIEMMVVVIVIAIVATMVLPRLVGQQRRQFQLTTDRVADLLTMFAQREALSGGQPVGIWHDKQRHALALMVLGIDPQDPDAPAEWRLDRMVRPIKFPNTIAVDGGVTVLMDGQPVDISEWPIATEPGRLRPAVTINLITNDGDTRTLVLAGHSLSPFVDDGRTRIVLREPIDLDGTGRHREDW